MRKEDFLKNIIKGIHKRKVPNGKLTLGEVIELVGLLNARTSDIVIFLHQRIPICGLDL